MLLNFAESAARKTTFGAIAPYGTYIPRRLTDRRFDEKARRFCVALCP